MTTIKTILQGKSEMLSTPGQILMQFGPPESGGGLPFHMHIPIDDANDYVVGDSYTITIEESE